MLTTLAGTIVIRCDLCGVVSALRGDIQHKYCGRCHLFHESVQAARVMQHDGTTHDCGDWPTGRGICAVCERPVATEKTDAESPL